MENKKIGLYKKVINRKMKLVKTEQKLDDRYKNYMSNGTIKVNRAKFMENAKNKIYDNHSKSKLKKKKMKMTLEKIQIFLLPPTFH